MLSLTITINPEGWDEEKQEFVEPKTTTIQLEHSLVSLSKWESKWHTPFLSKKELSLDEALDYIRCMTLTKNVPPEVYLHISQRNMNEVLDYIADPMTATTFREDKTQRPNREIITAEIIYYWMISMGVPFECRTWHLNRLLTLIRVCSIKNTPPKKRTRGDIMRQNAALNAARRKQLRTHG